MGAIWTAPLASKGALLDFDPYMVKWQDKDALFPDMLKDGAWEGKQCAVPFGLDLRIPVCRKDILTKAGWRRLLPGLGGITLLSFVPLTLAIVFPSRDSISSIR